MFTFENKIFLFDINGQDESNKKEKRSKKMLDGDDIKMGPRDKILFYCLNLQTFVWTCWRADDVPQVDDYAYCLDKDTGNLYLFGGYLNGTKSNILVRIHINTKKITILSPDTPARHPDSRYLPCQRTGARMAFLPKNGNIYMFGGLTATNQTLNDMWCFPTAGNKWHLVDQRGDVPDPRCGHSLNCHHDKLFLFGGLKEVT